ncbi:MAG TPA: SDR family NAD(P)-dependent oxidoreductase [Nocardia sp.]|uniref:SDR family NAD(P)-dependent oxidoreductase n=1 Tax=Nocardia TaxID=1817 RepID=UPI002454884E|nr:MULTISPECIES: SDR family NAD(P)-dependent oxidoreductase [Nocardia]HLS76604.1 SDR family NAD(P)-dependent oxidoreductase [Nocardia sp.]
MTAELAGRVAVVTGGASGIGAAIVAAFVAEGAHVVVADTDAETGAATAAGHGGAAVFRRVDVADPEQVAALVDHAVATFGGLHVMCNNAGISGTMHRSFLHDDLADFQRVLGVNLLGVMAGTRYAAGHMAGHGGGSIINLTSVGGLQAGGGVQTYRASKAAVAHFTKSAAIELARHGIRVNAIAPGNIPTPLLESSARKMPNGLGERFIKAMRANMAADRPLPVDGRPEDVADTAVYFASERSRYVTGAVLPVDGGTVAGKPLPVPAKPAQEVRG